MCGEASYGLTLLQFDKLTASRSYGLENDECATLWGMVSHYSALKDNYFNAIIVEAMSIEGEKVKGERNEEDDNSYGLTILRSYGLLRYLFAHRGQYVDYLSITETYLAENNFPEALSTLTQMYEKFKLTEEQRDELNGLEIYTHWLQQLHNEQNSIYSLSESELEYLANYVETHTGCGVVFANNILCGLYGICKEEAERQKNNTLNPDFQKAPLVAEEIKFPFVIPNEVRNLANDGVVKNGEASYGLTVLRSYGLEVYPNPGKDYITVVSELENILFELIDVVGNVRKSVRLLQGNNTINVLSLQQGVYVYRIVLDSKVISGKWIKM